MTVEKGRFLQTETVALDCPVPEFAHNTAEMADKEPSQEPTGCDSARSWIAGS